MGNHIPEMCNDAELNEICTNDNEPETVFEMAKYTNPNLTL